MRNLNKFKLIALSICDRRRRLLNYFMIRKNAVILFFLTLLLHQVSHSPSFCQDVNDSLYIVRRGTFLISSKVDQFEIDYVRIGYAPIGTVVYSDGDQFKVPNRNRDYATEEYLPIITESGIQGAVLSQSSLGQCVIGSSHSQPFLGVLQC